MSLAFSAIRQATVLALRDRTRAAASVYDSEIGPIEATATKRPAIIVYTDDLAADPGAPLLSNRGALTLTIALVVTDHAMTPEGEEVMIPPTDAGIELTVDFLARQVQVALADPGNPWAEALRGLAREMSLSGSMRGSNSREGLRLAGRELSLSVRPISDPLPGADLSPPWVSVLELAAEDESASVRAWGEKLTAMLADPGDDPAAVAHAAMGLTQADKSALAGDFVDADALIVEPADPTEPSEP